MIQNVLAVWPHRQAAARGVFELIVKDTKIKIGVFFLLKGITRVYLDEMGS